jgi:hypothetical protein
MSSPLKRGERVDYRPAAPVHPMAQTEPYDHGNEPLHPADAVLTARLESILKKPDEQNDRLMVLALALLDLTILEGAFLDEKVRDGCAKELVLWAEAYRLKGREMESRNAASSNKADWPPTQDPLGRGPAQEVGRE